MVADPLVPPVQELLREKCALDRCPNHVAGSPVRVDLSPPGVGMAGHVVAFCSVEHAIEEIAGGLADFKQFTDHMEAELRRLEGTRDQGAEAPHESEGQR